MVSLLIPSTTSSALIVVLLLVGAADSRITNGNNSKDINQQEPIDGAAGAGERVLTTCPPTSVDILVIGAGIAGLAAAETLSQSIYSDSFAVVERRPVVGGRIRTTTFAGLTVEEGPNWITGGSGVRNGNPHPIKALADQFGTEYYKQSYVDVAAYSDERMKFSTFKKKQVAIQQAFQQCVITFGTNQYDAFYDPNDDPELDRPLRVSLDQCGWELNDEFDISLEQFFFREYLGTPDNLGSYNFPDDSYSEFGKADNFVTDQDTGMQGIAQSYYDSLSMSDKFFFNQVVTKIIYDNPDGTVTVQLQGACDDITAQKAMFTGSMGIIENLKSELFDPPINTDRFPIEMGSWVKILVKFQTRFWNQDDQWIITAVSAARDECSVWLNFDFPDIHPGSKILLCLMDQATADNFAVTNGLGGPDFVFDDTNNAHIVALLQPLQTAFGNTALVYDQVKATNWLEDETAYGAWGNWKIDPNDPDPPGPDDFIAVGAPREGRFWISGADTCLNFWGYMHGGYFAGKRTANWIINCLDDPDPNSDCLDLLPCSQCDEVCELL